MKTQHDASVVVKSVDLFMCVCLLYSVHACCVCVLCSLEISSQLQSMMQSHCSEALRLLQLANTGSSADVSLSLIHSASH